MDVETPPIGVDDEEDTLESARCLSCAARATVEVRAARAHVTRATFVQSFHPVERWRAFICIAPDILAQGDGDSREEAFFRALDNAGAPK